mmetsp:Transcript_26466/g.82645  ORF Transcript_26466/g.82645 Transcript_26466/m.82645 type:complete len:1203 (+) Transcript_26466:451-4059(+)
MDSVLSRLPFCSQEQECDRVDARSVPVPFNEGEPLGFITNIYSTYIYEWYDFFPRALAGQFRRTGNQYFLVMLLVMCLGTFTPLFVSPIHPATIAMPLTIVLLISLAQEGYADLMRHRDDDAVNHKPVTQLTRTGQRQQIMWKDIEVGMLLELKNREEVPADVVILDTSAAEGLCYCETKAIDGETNLKRRMKPAGFDLSACTEDGGSELPYGAISIECDPVGTREQASIYTFNGRLVQPAGESLGVQPANVLLRGSVVRNTKRVVGAVVYTGFETKLAKNAMKTPSKLSQIDKLVNNAIVVVLGMDILFCVVSAVLNIDFENENLAGSQYLGYFEPGESSEAFRNATIYPQYQDMDWEGESDSFFPSFLTFLVLYYNVITISLYVTVEIVTRFMMTYIDSDLEMYHAPIDMPAKARSTTVTDLGQIEYIFSDKTGTLTQNIMKFKCCSVAGQIYGSAMPSGYIMDPEKMPYSSMPIEHLKGNIFAEKSTEGKIFAEVLSLCHSVVVERENGGIVYQAESPDEGALVAAASDIGYTLVSRDTSGMTIDIGKAGGAESKGVLFEELAINEFDATRKRMSVMIRYPDGKGRLLVKGADSSMLRVAANAESDEVANMNDHLVFFAKQGLRTLVLGYRDFTAQELEAWLTEYQTASTSVENHDQKVMDCAISAEKNLTIIGATAIEDKLQDGVPDTIETVLQAGIKFWVLTGDKRETAIEIGKSCGLIQEGMTMVSLRGGSESFVHWQLCELYSAFVSPEDQDAAAMDSASLSLMSCINDKSTVSNAISNMMASTEAPADAASRGVLSGTDLAEAIAAGGKVAFVMEGTALEHVMPFEHMKAMLFGVAAKCHAVVACRATPSQKALLVETVQTYVKPKPVTLAIGDGANDVGMIQKAQVGVGIAGLEGQQAVNASDFAIAQFRFLKRLLLVHGRWNYRRMSVVILYSFYKNFVMVVTLFLFNFSCGFSGTPLYDQWLYSAYNFFTTLPVIAVGIFEKDVSADYAMKHPYLYIQGRNNLDMDAKAICSWVGTALVHGIIIYGIPFLQYPGMTDDGMGQGFLVWGTTVFISLVFSMNTKVLEETRTVTYCGGETLSLGTKKGRKAWCSNFAGWTVFLWMFSMFFLFFVLLVYSTYPFASLEILGDLTFLDMGTFVLGRASTWAYSMFTPLVSTLVGSLPWLLFWAFFPTPLILSIEDSRLNGNGRHQV